MTRREYTEQVLANLHRMTKAERKAIRAELDAHMEDHICDLLDLGYSPELAEERTMALMGDPAEVGRELNRQYPLRWLVAKWAAMALTLVFVLAMLSPVRTLAGTVADNLWNRFYPLHQLDLRTDMRTEYRFMTNVVETDLRQTVDGVTMRVYQAGLECPTAKKTQAWVLVCLYSENPLYRAPQVFREHGMVGEVASPLGQEIKCRHPISQQRDTVFAIYSPVRWGKDLEFTYEQYGHRYAFSVPLPWEETPWKKGG